MNGKPLIIDAGIIAGGLGSRLDGADKGLLEWRGVEFTLHIAKRLRPYARKMIINCNRNSEHYWPLADLVVSDGDDAFNGPLAGLRSLLLAYSHLKNLQADLKNHNKPNYSALATSSCAAHPMLNTG